MCRPRGLCQHTVCCNASLWAKEILGSVEYFIASTFISCTQSRSPVSSIVSYTLSPLYHLHHSHTVSLWRQHSRWTLALSSNLLHISMYELSAHTLTQPAHYQTTYYTQSRDHRSWLQVHEARSHPRP